MDRVDEALAAMPRKNFLPEYYAGSYPLDEPIPIGFGQTNSQPSTVKLMLEWLDPQPGDKILDLGSGSGWTTALLAYLVGKEGKIYAVERIPELVEFGRENFAGTKQTNAVFYQAGKDLGLKKFAPFDRILVSAAAPKLHTELVDQLRIGGVLVIPVQDSIYRIERTGSKSYKLNQFQGFAFVKLIA